MEKLRTQRYAESLYRVIQNNHNYLKEVMNEFEEKCMLVTSVKTVPPRIVVEIPETYRGIQSRLNEINAIQQLLRAKYFLYLRKDPRRDKEITDLGHTAKAAFSKFEYAIKQIEEEGRLREVEQPPEIEVRAVEQPPEVEIKAVEQPPEVEVRAVEQPPEVEIKAVEQPPEVEIKAVEQPPEVEVKAGPFLFFQDVENQVMFLRNWRILGELDYEISASGGEEKREVSKDKPRSLTLFVFKGDPEAVDELQSHMSFREHDVIERYRPDELRGILTHLREVQPGEVEKIFERFKAIKGYSSLKYLLIPIRSQKDYESDIIVLIEKAFGEMTEGEMRTLSA
jgi:hypothetical protein